jgi:hypothetical protein
MIMDTAGSGAPEFLPYCIPWFERYDITEGIMDPLRLCKGLPLKGTLYTCYTGGVS